MPIFKVIKFNSDKKDLVSEEWVIHAKSLVEAQRKILENEFETKIEEVIDEAEPLNNEYMN